MTKTGLAKVELAINESYSPGKGYETRRRYEGTGDTDGINELNQLRAMLAGSGWSFSVTGINGPKWTLEATRGGSYNQSGPDGSPGNEVTEPLSDQWELSSNLVEKDLLESDSPMINSLYLESISPGSGVTFARFMKDLKEMMEDPSKIPTTFSNPFPFPVYKAIIQLIQSGVKSVRIFQPTLRHVKIVADAYSVEESMDRCGQIIKAADIEALEGIPGELHFNLPSGTNARRTDDFGKRLYYGWCKKYPNVSQQAEGKWQITTEYEWGLWHQDLYQFAT